MIAVDYTTKFFDIHSLTDNLSLLSGILSAYLQNSIFHSDNDSEFKANEFKIFAQKRDFQHDTSNVLYPQSNGLVESAPFSFMLL